MDNASINHCHWQLFVYSLFTNASIRCFLHHFLSSTIIEVSFSKSHDSCESLTESDCVQCPCFTRPFFIVFYFFSVGVYCPFIFQRSTRSTCSSISSTFPFKYLDFAFSPKSLRHSAKFVSMVAGARTAAPCCFLGSVAIGFESSGIRDFSQKSTKLFLIITYFSNETFRMAFKCRFHVICCRKVSNLFLLQAFLIVK